MIPSASWGIVLFITIHFYIDHFDSLLTLYFFSKFSEVFFSKYSNGKRKSPFIRAYTVILLHSLDWKRLTGQFQIGLRIISTAQPAHLGGGGGGD